MRNSAENYIAQDKSLELDKSKEVKHARQLDKMRKADESPVFDASDNPDGDDFVNANDPENKFVPIEEVADPDSDFLEKEQEEEEEEVVEQEEEGNDEKIKEVRKSIGDYAFKQRGSKFSNLESFHVNHDKSEMLAISSVEGGLVNEGEDNDDSDLELADSGDEAKRGTMPGRLSDTPKYGSDQKRIDNLKTWGDNKRQRAERGAIREFLEQPIESSEEIKAEEELEKINKNDKSLWQRFLDRLN